MRTSTGQLGHLICQGRFAPKSHSPYLHPILVDVKRYWLRLPKNVFTLHHNMPAFLILKMLGHNNSYLPTAYVARREGYVLTRVCPSVCPHPVGGEVPQLGPGGGDTPARSRQGVPHLGYPPQTWLGVPHLGYPPGQVWPEVGYPPVRSDQGGTQGGVPWLGGTPPWVPPWSDLTRGYPTSGTPYQTWLGCTPMGGAPPWVPPVRPGRGGTHRVVLDTLRSVCLLRWRRRTFLFRYICTNLGAIWLPEKKEENIQNFTRKRNLFWSRPAQFYTINYIFLEFLSTVISCSNITLNQLFSC